MTESDWDFFQCHVNGKPASIYVDLGLKKMAPDPNRGSILCVWVYFMHPNPENGLSTQEEFEALSGIEDALSAALSSHFSAIYAGRITNDGRREFYFYSHTSTDLQAIVHSALAKFAGYKVEAWAQADAEWGQYVNLLYPSKHNLRWMSDRRVVDALGRQGDVPEVSRPIEHYSYFPTAHDSAAFSSAVRAHGFELVRTNKPSGDDNSFGIVYKKTQAATLDAVFKTTGFLEEQSARFHGDYDGWESMVMKPKEKAKKWWQLSK